MKEDPLDVLGVALYLGVCLHEKDLHERTGTPLDPDMTAFLGSMSDDVRSHFMGEATLILTQLKEDDDEDA